MAAAPFRFVLSGDFRLGESVQGVADIPDDLAEVLLEGPYRAATAVFDAVLDDEADFLLLAGNLLDVETAGPRGLVFLLAQFERLASRDVPVYWVGGPRDPCEAWPESAALPGNVHRFPTGRVKRYLVRRDDRPLAQIVGSGAGPDQEPVCIDRLRPRADGPYSIGLAWNPVAELNRAARHVNCLALGGRSARHKLDADDHREEPAEESSAAGLVVWPGTPQGRGPDEAGPRGATIVEVGSDGRTRTRLIATDHVRWISEEVDVAGISVRSQLESVLAERVEALRARDATRPLAIHWRLVGEGPLAAELRRGEVGRGGIGDELLNGLRSHLAGAEPPVWCVGLESEPARTVPTSWRDEDTIRGDFLRALEGFAADERGPLPLAAYLAPDHVEGPLGRAAVAAEGPRRTWVLREAARLGADLLGGSEEAPAQETRG